MSAWNPSDKSTHLALSNVYRTATATSGAANEGVRSPVSHASGKWYLEYSNITFGAGAGFGFGSATELLTDNNLPALRLNNGGGVNTPNGFAFTGPGTSPAGAVIGWAVDLDNNRAWVRYDGGLWFGPSGSGADPSTPSTGFDLTSRAATLFPKLWLQFTPGTCDINSGDRAFAHAAPTGFTAWDSSPPPNSFSATVIH